MKPGEVGFGTPFAAAIDHLRRKLDLPTQAWDDIQRQAHDRAFIVAGAAQADLVQDLHRAVIAAGEGEGLAGFRKQFKDIVARHGWTGWTGEGSAAGLAWRTRVIYQTNMATAQAAGRWRQLTDPEVTKLLPWWTYRHADGVLHPRPQHQAWHGLTLRHDHPFWKTHWPPNGWGCRCKAFALARPPQGAATEPPAGWDKLDATTGEPRGIDRGFGYAPGANAATPLQSIIDAKLINLDAPIGAAMWQALKPALAMERQQQWWDTLATWLADPLPRGRSAVVGTLDPQALDWLMDNGHRVPDSAEMAIADRLVVGAKQRRHLVQQNALTEDEWRALPSLLDRPGGLYRDKRSGNLVFVADGLGPAKTVVEFADGGAGLNRIDTAFRVSDADIAGMVKGDLWQVIRVVGSGGPKA